MSAQEAAKSMIWVCPVPLFGLAVDSRLAAIDQNKLFWSLISTKLQCNKYQTGDQNKLFWSKISAVSLTAWLSSGCNEPSAAVRRGIGCRLLAVAFLLAGP